MSLKNIIEKRVNKEISELDSDFNGLDISAKSGIAFMLYSLKTILKDSSIEDIEKGIVDSLYRKEKYDFGIDAVYLLANGEIVDSPEEIETLSSDTKFIFDFYQFKKGTGIDQASLLKFKDGLEKVFVNNKCSISDNEYMYNYFKNLSEMSDGIYENFHSSNILIRLNICFSGVSENLRKEPIIDHALNSIESMLKDNSYKNVKTIVFGDQELLDSEKEKSEITSNLEYKKYFNYITGDIDNKLNGFIAMVNASVIAKLVQEHGNRLFEANIRDYYNNRGVNNKIYDTAISDEESNNFWGYNNGLTITCRKVDELPNEKLKLSGLQIVNGCQTSNTLYEAFKQKTLKNDTFLLVKIIETENSDLIYKITEATNSQTAITMYNLKANEVIHKNIETYFAEHNIYYERRVNFYKNKKVTPIVDIKKLAQLYLSMILFKPSSAKAHPKASINKEYSNIFPNVDDNPYIKYELYLAPALVMLSLEKLITKIRRKKDGGYNNYQISLMANGKFHLACLLLSDILKSNYNDKGIVKNINLISNKIKDETAFIAHFNNALNNFEKLSKKEFGTKLEAIAPSLRKSSIEESINKFIHKNIK